jgi:hypothetical protein
VSDPKPTPADETPRPKPSILEHRERQAATGSATVETLVQLVSEQLPGALAIEDLSQRGEDGKRKGQFKLTLKLPQGGRYEVQAPELRELGGRFGLWYAAALPRRRATRQATSPRSTWKARSARSA